MRSSYKKIGRYVQQLNKRNKDMAVTNLQGININKLFMPSVANTVGVDLSKYKIVFKHQFAFNPMHVGRDEMLPISMLEADEPVIVSPAYVVFKIKDHEELDPEYLMMWCRRPEFDRNAWFTTDSSVRGGFSWSDFCEMELPVPTIEKQREIVREYNAIVNRLVLNERLNQKLEETAQAIYKRWFVDFEFPVSAEYAAALGKPELKGKPYKSCGGEMVFCEGLNQEIPIIWKLSTLDKILVFKNGKTRPQNIGTIPVYGGNGVMDYTDSCNNENVIVIGRVGAYCGSLYRVNGKCWVSDNAIYAVATVTVKNYCFYLLKNLKISENREGTGQPLLTQGILNNISFARPNTKISETFDAYVTPILRTFDIKNNENNVLRRLSITLLAKMSKPKLLELAT